MARRKKTSALDALFELVAMLPWWAGILIALTSYLVLHAYAVKPLPPATLPTQVAASFVPMFTRGLASAFQYIVPIVSLFAAAASAWKRSQRKALVETVANNDSASSLNAMSWQEFEGLVAEAFRLKGFKVEERGGAGPDGGIDLVLSRGTERFLVQCKQWKALKVGVATIRELYGVMAAQGATGGFVVTSGSYSQDAIDFSKGRNISLIDGKRLFAMVQEAKAASSKSSANAPSVGTGSASMGTAYRGTASKAAGQSVQRAPAAQTEGASPPCPACGGLMIRREAKRGANAGKAFWGCASFPSCRGTAAM